ncbi:hypothetical protein [Paractinoplanes maris]|uniref:hypothetical protein n=1 Tax=Paractinoplanes maris TaxID=1734446 RepID=UPI002021972B|nr:hypothetical protein [Actinoplanes maris]
MSEPEAGEVHRAVVALTPFVRRWDLPLNPEDMEELAYALLFHARSPLPLDEIPAAVDRQIDQHEERARQLFEAMGRAHTADPPTS